MNKELKYKVYGGFIGVIWFLLLFISSFGFFYVLINDFNKDVNYSVDDDIKLKVKELSTDDLYKVWQETSMGTSINSFTYDELDERGYWEEKDKIIEEKDIKFFNEFIKNK